MSIELFTKYVVPVLGLLTPIIAVVVFRWTYLRPHVRKLEIIDMAAKRLAFWDQLLKLQLTTISLDAAERDKLKQQALLASQRIHADANEAMTILVWEKKLNKKFGLRAFKLDWPTLPGLRKKVEWSVCALMSVLFLALASYIFVLFLWGLAKGKTFSAVSQADADIFILASFGVSRFFQSQAEILKHPNTPLDPMIDKI